MTDGRVALGRGDWQAAKEAFESTLHEGESPEALEGLGLAAWWLDLADIVFDARERAYRGYLERGDRAAAARMAVWIAWDSAAFRGEQAVANGWLQRARRLLEEHPGALENAWLALRAGVFALLDDGDPEERRGWPPTPCGSEGVCDRSITRWLDARFTALLAWRADTWPKACTSWTR
jgi:hypothetical protein